MSSSNIEVTMPQMGVSVAEGTLVAWRVEVGEEVRAEETVCEISTDKIDSEVPAPADGVLAEILVPVGATVPVGTVLARIGSGADDVTEVRAEAPRLTPVVQRIVAEHHLDLAGVRGSGRGGRIRKQDVLALLDRERRSGNGSRHGNGNGGQPGNGAQTTAPARASEEPLHTESPYRPEPPPAASPMPAGGLSHMRRQIGAHMKRSLETAATCTSWIEVDMSRVERERAERRLTALSYVARAAIEALREHPSINATLDGEAYTRHEAIHLGIAVSLGDAGLIVPVIRDAHELSAEGLGARVKDLARRARAGELSPDEVRGGTFTITNPGQFGTIMATPIINQPQVAILDIEAIVKRPVVVADAGGTDAIAIRPMSILGLSWDHRALDGVEAAQFLATVRDRLEQLAAAR